MSHNNAAQAVSLHAGFLALLPRIQTHARIHFRHVRCPGKREDLVAEAVAVAWKWYLRAVEVGKDPADFLVAFSRRVASHVRCGRRLCRADSARDALSPVAQRKHSFVVQTLPEVESGVEDNQAIDALRDNTRTPPPDQAAFRIDFPLWLASLQDRKRLLAEDLMLGERTQDAALKHNVSQARVSQVRRELLLSWCLFHGEAVT